MLKMSDNPPIVFPPGARIQDIPGRWWVAHTKSRFEKTFAWELLRMDVPYFLPMLERVRVSGGRKRRVIAPLFTSYVFLCGDSESRYKALTTHRLCQVIPVLDQACITEELSALQLALEGEAVLDPYPFAAVGQRCRIRSGPFQGLEGIVVQRTKVARIVLEVSILGQGAVMEVDADLLEPAE